MCIRRGISQREGYPAITECAYETAISNLKKKRKKSRARYRAHSANWSKHRRATRIAPPRWEASSGELPDIANERYPEAAGGNGGYIEVNLHKEGPRSGHLSRDRCHLGIARPFSEPPRARPNARTPRSPWVGRKSPPPRSRRSAIDDATKLLQIAVREAATRTRIVVEIGRCAGRKCSLELRPSSHETDVCTISQ